MEEHESRLESYQLTLSMLRLIDSLVKARFKRIDNDSCGDFDRVGNLDNGAFEPYVAYVRDTVLVKAAFRSYKNIDERWEVSALCLEILSKLLDYVPQLMYQMLCGSPFMKSVRFR